MKYESRSEFGCAISDLSFLRRWKTKLISKPKWMQRHGELGLEWFLSAEKDLKSQGIVVPGAIIQANSLLFEPGNDDHPGEILYTLTPQPDIAELVRSARQIYLLKGEHSRDQEESFFSKYLANELSRVRKVPVSNSLSQNPETYVSSSIFYRRHLPGGILNGTVFPVLVTPESGVAMILPMNLWSERGHEIFCRYMHT